MWNRTLPSPQQEKYESSRNECVAGYVLSGSNKYTQIFHAQLANLFPLFFYLVVQYNVALLEILHRNNFFRHCLI